MFYFSIVIDDKIINLLLYEKNDFIELFKNLAGYRSENNFVGPSK